MSQFLGTHQNRLDAKGRVSIPAAFRAALRDGMDADAPTAVVLRPSHKHACIECWPLPRFEAQKAALDPFSDEYEDMLAVTYGDTVEIEADKEGRIVLTGEQVRHAGLAGQVAFMGMGATFQIWEPEAATRRLAEARSATRLRELRQPARGTA